MRSLCQGVGRHLQVSVKHSDIFPLAGAGGASCRHLPSPTLFTRFHAGFTASGCMTLGSLLSHWLLDLQRLSELTVLGCVQFCKPHLGTWSVLPWCFQPYPKHPVLWGGRGLIGVQTAKLCDLGQATSLPSFSFLPSDQVQSSLSALSCHQGKDTYLSSAPLL